MPEVAPARDIRIGDVRVPRMGFGAMRITGRGIWGPPSDRPSAVSLLRHVVDVGVRFIDTADSYGPYVSEELIAEALAPYRPDLLIATKGGLVRPGPDQWEPSGHPKHLREACEGSLRRLKLECIGLYQLHTVDPTVPVEESMGALKELQSEGKIRYIGVCNVSVAELRRAQSVAKVLSVQNRYNIEDRSADDVLETCAATGIPFIPWHPLGGLESMPSHIVDTLTRIGKGHGATYQQIELAWLLYRSPIMAPIPGTTSIPHFDENMDSTKVVLSPSEVAELTALAR